MKFNPLEESPVCLDLVFPLILIILTQAISFQPCHMTFGSGAEISNNELKLCLSLFNLITRNFILFKPSNRENNMYMKIAFEEPRAPLSTRVQSNNCGS